MSKYDDEAFVREMQHKEMIIQNRRRKNSVRLEGEELRAECTYSTQIFGYEIKDDNNEIN